MEAADIEKLRKIVAKQTTPEKLEEGHRIWVDCVKNTPNNFSYWFPKLVSGLQNHYDKIKVPLSFWVTMPDDMLGVTLCENPGDYEKLCNWVNTEVTGRVKSAFYINGCFMKNGCFSNKFDFVNSCRLHADEITTQNIVKKIRNIEEWALAFETGGDLEFVFRQWIEPSGRCYIYNGMPLRPEVRVFFNFDTKKSLYSVNYWDWNYCSPNLNDEDRQTFENKKWWLELIYGENKDKLEKLLEEILVDVDLEGIWSVDLMYENSQWYLIDMALGFRSAYWDPEKIKNNE